MGCKMYYGVDHSWSLVEKKNENDSLLVINGRALILSIGWTCILIMFMDVSFCQDEADCNHYSMESDK